MSSLQDSIFIDESYIKWGKPETIRLISEGLESWFKYAFLSFSNDLTRFIIFVIIILFSTDLIELSCEDMLFDFITYAIIQLQYPVNGLFFKIELLVIEEIEDIDDGLLIIVDPLCLFEFLVGVNVNHFV